MFGIVNWAYSCTNSSRRCNYFAVFNTTIIIIIAGGGGVLSIWCNWNNNHNPDMILNVLVNDVSVGRTGRVFSVKLRWKEGKRKGFTHQKSLSVNSQSVYGGSTFLHLILRAVNTYWFSFLKELLTEFDSTALASMFFLFQHLLELYMYSM